jgi:hypothetical protein
MGLDMFAYSVPREDALTPLKFKDGSHTEIHYWRKHHDLHGWMERLWDKKRKETQNSLDERTQFNCAPVELTLEDLDELEKDVNTDNLPNTVGFFFGNFPPDEESKKKDIEFIQRAREEINEGKAVYYDSWW